MMQPSLIAIIAAAALTVVFLLWRAWQRTRRHAEEAAARLASINDLGLELLRAQLNVEGLCELVYEQAGEIVPTDNFQLGLFAGDAYDVKVSVRDGERMPPGILADGGRAGLVGWVRETAEPLLIENFDAECSRFPEHLKIDPEDVGKSGLFVPLIAGTATIGIIAVQSELPHRFDPEHLELLTALANLAAAAIRNAQLYESAEYRAEQLNLVAQVSAQVSAVQPLADLFEQFVTLTKETFGYYYVGIFVLKDGHLVAGATSDPAVADLEIELGQGMVGWAVRQGQPALAGDVVHDPRYWQLGVLPETRSELALPLKVENRVLGVLDVQSEEVDAFSSEDVLLLDTLARQIAIAMEQAETYETERELTRQLEILVQVSQAIVSILDLDDLLDRLVELISEAFGFERVHIFIRIGDMLVFRAGVGPQSVRWLINELSYGVDEHGLIPKVARTAEPVLIGDVQGSPDYRVRAGLENTRSEMAIPMQMAGRVMGVLDVQSEQPNAFSDEQFVLMQSLADSAAVAIRNAALYANERRRRNLADTLREVSATLASMLDTEDVIAEVLEGLRRVTELNTAAILLFEDHVDMLTLYATSGAGLEGFFGQRIAIEDFAPDEGGTDNAIRRLHREVFGLSGDEALITVPLAVGGRLIGYLVAEQRFPWLQTTDDVEIISAFASQAAIAISNARLYAAQQVEAYVTTVLLQVAEAVNAQVNDEAALETIARLTALLAGVSRCLILRWDPDERAYYPAAQYGVGRKQYTAQRHAPIPAEEFPLLDLLSVTDQPLGAGQGYQLPVPPPIVALLPSPAVMCFPLLAKSGLVGLLIVDDPRKSTNPRLMSILTGIAHQTATVLETARLQTSAAERRRLEQELEVARSIQASFIPDEAPEVPGWELAAAWRAARQVSGDFYDFIPLQDGKWGLVVADVADKGTPAALFMAVCRTLVRAAAISRTSPARTLVRVNQLLFSDARTDLFVTVFYAVWDPATGMVSYASAGHNAPLYLRAADRQIVELECDGIALGVLREIELEERQITMQPGDTLIAYTDGVTEAMLPDYTEWGMRRFRAAVLEAAGEDAQAALDYILTEVERFVGGAAQSDDLTLWVLRRRPVQDQKRGDDDGHPAEEPPEH